MAQSNIRTHIWLIASLMLATLFEVYPLPVETNAWRPQWLLLAVVFWVLRRPLEYGVVMGFFAGLLLDVISGGVPGRYALAMCLCVYVLKLVEPRLRHSTVWHRSILVFLLSLLMGSVIISVDKLVWGLSVASRDLWVPAFCTAFLWLFLTLLLWRLPKPE